MPVAPVAPADPVVPVNPVLPVRPVEPVNPVLPVKPVAPVNPVLPVNPVAPVIPVAPILPVAPAEPQLKLPAPSVTKTCPAVPPVIITLPISPKFASVCTTKLYTPKLVVLALLLTCNVPKIFIPV